MLLFNISSDGSGGTVVYDTSGTIPFATTPVAAVPLAYAVPIYIATTAWNTTDVIISDPMTTVSGDIFSDFGTYLSNKVGVLSTTLPLDQLRTTLQSQKTDNDQMIFLTQSTGAYLTSTFNTSLLDYNLDGIATFQSVPELVAFNVSVMQQYGGWSALSGVTSLTYVSPTLGTVLVEKKELEFANRKWYVFVAWPSTTWNKKIANLAGANVGSGAAVLIVSIIVCILVSTHMTSNIRQIRDCFDRIRTWELDAAVINKTIKQQFVYYEPHALQHSFQNMLTTLQSFQKYVPTDVVKRIVHSGDEASLGLQQREATVLFMDVKDFTKMSEALHPHDLVTIMSEAFDGLSEIITQNEGIIDKVRYTRHS
jgi:hypothetical protein